MVLNPSIKKSIAGGTAPLISTYDWVDIEAGAGYITYYGGQTTSGAVVYYVLSNQIFDSQDIKTLTAHNNAGAETSYSKLHDLDFDITFNIPRIMNGTIIATVPQGNTRVTAGKTVRSYIQVVPKRVRNGTETELGTVSGAIFTVAGTNTPGSFRIENIKIPIDTERFTRDDVFRLTVEQFVKNGDDNTNAEYFVGHDPNNRLNIEGSSTVTSFPASGSTILKVQVPFRIDI